MLHSRSRRLPHYLCIIATLGLSCLALTTDASAARSKKAVARRASAALAKAAAAVTSPARVQPLLDAMCAQLDLDYDVTVEVVDDNPLKASVAPIKGSERAFRLSIDKAFLRRLNQAELRTVLVNDTGNV